VHCFVVFRSGQPELSFFYLLISDLVLALHTQVWEMQSSWFQEVATPLCSGQFTQNWQWDNQQKYLGTV
jgi:hypothetical protein